MKPKHHNNKFVATREFTDRVDAVTLFSTTIENGVALDECKVLNWYGVGGEGKSALLKKCLLTAKQLNEGLHSTTQFVTVKVDLATPEMRMIENALLSLRLQLGLVFGTSFPCFDTAFARYHVKTTPNIDIRSKFPELFKGENTFLNDTIELVKDIVDELPGIGFFYKYSSRLSIQMKEWYKRRGCHVLKGLDLFEPEELLAKLPEYLGADLYDVVSTHPNYRIFIGFDTYEALWRDTNTSDPLLGARHDGWVRTLVEYAPGILFGIFGRDKLQWAHIEPDWENSIDSYRLGALSEEDSHAFLKKVPIDNIEIRNRIVESAEGLPFYLDLQVQLFETLTNNNRVSVEEFGGSHVYILQRFLDHLSEKQHTLVRLASYPLSLSEEELIMLFKAHGGGINNLDWGWLIRQSFIDKDESGVYSMHSLMRESLQEKEENERPKIFKAVHQVLFESYDKPLSTALVSEISTQHDSMFFNALHHRLRSELSSTMKWFNIRAINHKAAQRTTSLIRTHTVLLNYLKIQNQISRLNELAFRHNLAHLMGRQGRYAEAEKEFRAIHEILSQELGVLHPKTLNALVNLAQQIKSQGRYAEAEALFHAIYEALKQPDVLGERHPHTLNTRANLADLILRQGRLAEAEAELRAIYNIQRQADVLGEEHPDTLSTRAMIASEMDYQGRYAEAEKELRAIYKIESKPEVLGIHHPSTLSTRSLIAACISSQGRYAEAEKELRAIYKIESKPEVLGIHHPSTLNTRAQIACEMGNQGRYAEAEKELRATYEIQRQADVLGERHPETLSLRSLISYEMGKQGRYAEAEKELRAIYETQRQADVLGEQHPYTLNTRSLMATYIGNQGRYAEAEKEFRAIWELGKHLDLSDKQNPYNLMTQYNIAKMLHMMDNTIERDKILAGLEEKLLSYFSADHKYVNKVRQLKQEIAKRASEE